MDDTSEFLIWADRQEIPAIEVPGYRSSAEIFADIAAAVRARPGVVSVEDIGHTSRGAPIWAFSVVDPAHPPERSVLVFGGLHPLEWLGPEVAADALLAELDRPEPGVRVTVVPIVNLDGRRDVEKDLVAGQNVYRRGNAHHVDLNRDFAVNTEVRAVWSHIIPGYYEHSERPFMAPESRALDALAGREVFDRAVSLHAYGGFIYWPWAGDFHRPADEADFRALGTAMQRAQGGRAYRPMQLGRWGFFFRAQGAEIDHLYGEYGTRAFLIELSKSGIEPWRPSSFREHFRWYNPRNPELHLRLGLRAVQALIREPPTPGEREHPASITDGDDSRP